MDNFDTYSYARTLRFLEAYYPYDTEDVHYANVMLSMNQCKTIDELIAVREHLKEKVDKISYFNVDKLPKDIIDEISKSNSITYHPTDTRIKDNLRADINSCYDENVFRLFEEKTITANSCGEHFINLSLCWEGSKYKKLIIHGARYKANIDVSELMETIAKRYEEFREHWKKFKDFTLGMNGYNSAKELVEDDFEYLKQFNWRLLPWEQSLYSEIDREEQKKKEEQARLLKEKEEEKQRKREELARLYDELKKKEDKEREEHEKVLKIQRDRRTEEERKRKEKEFKKERRTKIAVIVLGVIVAIGVMVLICLYVPSEVMNLFWAILLWLAIMKTIINKL